MNRQFARYTPLHHFRDSEQSITWEFCEGFLDGEWTIVFTSDKHGKFTIGMQMWSLRKDKKQILDELNQFWRKCWWALANLNVENNQAVKLGQEIHQEWLEWLKQLGLELKEAK